MYISVCIEDPEFVATLPLSRTQWVVSTVRDRGINRVLLHSLREQGYTGKVAVATFSLRMRCLRVMAFAQSHQARLTGFRLFPKSLPVSLCLQMIMSPLIWLIR